MRAPLELGWSPSPASITPAFTSSALNFPIAVSSSALGMMPASESFVALTITMTRIVLSPLGFVLRARIGLLQTRRTRGRRFRQGSEIWFPNPFRGREVSTAHASCPPAGSLRIRRILQAVHRSDDRVSDPPRHQRPRDASRGLHEPQYSGARYRPQLLVLAAGF